MRHSFRETTGWHFWRTDLSTDCPTSTDDVHDFEIAQHFYELANLLKRRHNPQYRSRAFFQAALALDAYGTDIQRLWQTGTLKPFKNVGKGVLAKIDELLRTGRIAELELLRCNVTRIAGPSGPAKEEPGLQESLFQNRDSEAKLYHSHVPFLQYAHAEAIGTSLTRALMSSGKVLAAQLVGEVSREHEVVFELAVVAVSTEWQAVRSAIERNRFVRRVAEARPTLIDAILECGCRLTVEICNREQFASRVLFGSSSEDQLDYLRASAHEHGLSLRPDGLRNGDGEVISVASERDIYSILGMTYLPVPLREAVGARTRLTLEKERDTWLPYKLRGDLHVHSEWSDGLDSLESIADAASHQGYEHVLVTDHTAHLRIARGLDVQKAMSQERQLREIASAGRPCRLLRGIEVEILRDGTLDFPPSFLRSFDVVVGAVHDIGSSTGHKMLDRIDRALGSGAIDILAHPTGRLLGRPGMPNATRAPYIDDIEALCQICRTHGVALEINCFPERMDLEAAHAALAVKHGLHLSIGTDAHSIRHLPLARHGASIAMRALAPHSSLLNTLSADELIAWARARRSRGQNRQGDTPKHVMRPTLTAAKGRHALTWLKAKVKSRGRANPIVVGIDLSAGVYGKTGWAMVQGAATELRTVGNDNQIIEETLAVAPTVVSIDSPLGLPKGRCCSRHDCPCAEYGITREVERRLAGMGIGVYPCLIPSMAALTLRGVRIAAELRSRGLDVIESYPGAAQDILGIPRKRNNMILLQKGIEDFGLRLPQRTLIHDELDAATSALVGLYWLAHEYLAIGNDAESSIVVPRVPRFSEPKGKCIAIGFSGPTAVGKTTAALYVAFKYGLKYARYSLMLQENLRKRGIEPTKRALQDIGLEMHRSIGPEGLTKMLLSKMSRDAHWVVDGLRHFGDARTMRKEYGGGFLHIHLSSEDCIRQKRFRKSCTTENITPLLFRDIEEHEVEAEVSGMASKADHVIINGGSLKALFRELDKLMTDLQES